MEPTEQDPYELRGRPTEYDRRKGPLPSSTSSAWCVVIAAVVLVSLVLWLHSGPA
jgi:hypothetical protein